MKAPIDPLVERGRDPKGHGDYGMPRGSRKHQGWDIEVPVGATLSAPFSGKITKHGWMYKNQDLRYVEISSETFRLRLGYTTLAPGLKVGDFIGECETLSIQQDIAGFWGGGMKNHCHLQLWKNGLLTDPEPYFT